MLICIVNLQEINRKLLGFPSYLGQETSFHEATPGMYFSSRFEPHKAFESFAKTTSVQMPS